MTVADWFENRDNYCVRLDWRAAMEDALYAMRNQWGPQHQFLYDTAFNDLAENYGGESSDEQILGLGQELTTYGLALYSLDEGSDEYCMLLVPKDDMAAFEGYAKEHAIGFDQLKQTRKKFGDAAKRIKLSARLPHESFDLKGRLIYAGNVAADIVRHYTEGVGFSHNTCSLLDLSQWPPREHPQLDIVSNMAYNAKYKLWAAVMGEDELHTSLKISESPLDPMFWREIPFCEEADLYARENDPAFRYYNADVLDPISRLFWVGKDLLVAYTRRHKPGSTASVTHVWVVENAAKGGTECRKVMVTAPCEFVRGEFPALAQTQSGEIFLLFSGHFYTWKDGELHEAFAALDHTDFHAMPTGAHRFAYMDNEGRLVEVDTPTGRMRFRMLEYMDYKATVRMYNKKWAVFLRWGYTNTKMDIAQFWNITDDNWLRLPLGALGKEGIRNVRLLADNTVLLQTDSKLCHVADLFGFLRKQRKKKPEVSAWSEDWDETPTDEQDAANAAAALENTEGQGFFSKFLNIFKGDK